MNILIDKLPNEYEGLEINTDFRSSILFELLMQDNSLSPELKIRLSLSLYYKDIPLDIKKALNGILWFYKCGKEDKKTNKKTKQGKNNQIYSFEHDADYIYSAFLEQYGIDLNKVNMHWWKFRALFNGLNENTMFSKITGYRSMNTEKIKDKEQREYYEKMKRMYALPDNRTIEEKESDFANALV